ncbi:serine/threonine-protein kinase [Streptomyces sp. NPDC087440]|uniref:serine/threonine-protein kinase n=1 Tax=Streptomyces sp. NPDC087440 TaxID=3365790 RepID=UPI003819CCD2
MHQGTTAGGQFQPLVDNDPRTVAGYRIAARLGAGGMGQVYLSYTPGGHPIAVKVIRPELGDDPGFRQRFRSEVQAAQRVQGLYTAPVIDFDTEGERPWLATAYVPGPSLAVAVGEHGRFPAATVLRLVAGMAEALKVIHGAGIVHRDLKPANVLLASDGPRVIDFGIARAADATALTGTGVTVGTPAFMSPEQAEGKAVGPASDVFALGQVGVFAALANSAYGQGNSHAVLYRIVHEEPDLTGLPAELDFLARCLAKDPADRPDPAGIIELCRAASPTPLSQQGSWLPEPMEADIHRRTEAWAAMRTSLNATPAGPGPALHHAPTATAAPATPATPPPPPAAVPAQPPYPAQPTPAGPASYPTSPQHSLHSAPYPMHSHTPPSSWAPPPKKKMSGGVIALIVLGVLGVVAVGGCAAVVAGLSDRGPDGRSGTGGGTRASGTPRPDPKPVTYTGVHLTNDYYIRFADSPPKPLHSGDAAYEDDADFYYWSDERYLGSNGEKVSLLNNSQKGSLKTCREETRFTERITLSQVSRGSQLCVHTQSGHIALITYRGRSAASEPADYVTLDLTVWRNAEEPSGSGY